MQEQVFIQTREEFIETQRKLFEEILEEKLPKLIRAANRKEYLTTADFEELTGASRELQQYYRDQKLIAYSREGRKIWYKTEDVEKFMAERRIEAKE